MGKPVVELTGDFSPDLAALETGSVVVTTPEKWDGVSRSWRQRDYVRQVGLVVIDEIHLLGLDRGKGNFDECSRLRKRIFGKLEIGH